MIVIDHKVTERVKRVLDLAVTYAREANSPYLGVEHLLAALLWDQSPEGMSTKIITGLGIDQERLRRRVVTLLPNHSRKPKHHALLNESAKTAVSRAAAEAKAKNHAHVGTEDLLVGILLTPDNGTGEICTEAGLTVERVREEIPRAYQSGVIELYPGADPNEKLSDAEIEDKINDHEEAVRRLMEIKRKRRIAN